MILRKKMIDIEKFLIQSDKDAEKLPENERVKLRERIKEMWSEYSGEDRIVTSFELVEMLEREDTQKKIFTGFGRADKLIGGFTYEQLVILSAQEKSGKTTFALQLVGSMKDENPCCFLFEQSPAEIIRQMKERGQVVPYFVTPLRNIDNRYEWFEARALEAMVKKNSRLFLIDNVDWLEKGDW